MLAKKLREVLLVLVHLILTLFEKFTEFSDRIKAWRNPEKPVHNEVEYIYKFMSRLERRPRHLVVQVERDWLDVQELALMAMWCLWSGIPYISFYDADGCFKQINDNFFQEVEKYNSSGLIKWGQSASSNGISNYHNGFHNRSDGIRNGHNDYSHNRHSDGAKPHITLINVINRHKSTQGLVHLIKDLVTKKVSCRYQEEFYTTEEIDNLLKQYHYYPNIPEPDIMIYFGPVCMTKGLLPWHIRLTEFIPMRKHKSLHIDDYLSVLNRFSKCAVNLGK